MINSIELLEIEKFFSSINIPQVVKTNAATTYTDAPKFITENIELLKGKGLSPIVAQCRWEMLNDLKKAILDPLK